MKELQMFTIDPNKEYNLIITGDVNDADTMSKTTKCLGSKILQFVPLIEQIRRQSGHDFPDGTSHNFFLGTKDGAQNRRWHDVYSNGNVVSFYESKGISKELIMEFVEMCPYDWDGDYGIHTLWKVDVEEIVVIPTKNLFNIHDVFHWDNGKRVFH